MLGDVHHLIACNRNEPASRFAVSTLGGARSLLNRSSALATSDPLLSTAAST